MTTETIWGGLPTAKGLGEKKILVKTLEDTDFADETYPVGGSIVTLSELEKVDFALLEVMSCEAFDSGNVIAKAVTYSGNKFNMKLLSCLSNDAGLNDKTQMFDETQVSGTEISGVMVIRAFLVGEAKEGFA